MHAHFDCFSGISGDMVLGAFVDLGLPVPWLTEQIGLLDIGDVEIAVQDVKKKGIGAKRVNIFEKQASPERNYGDIVRLIEATSLGDPVKSIALDIFNRIATAEARIHRCRPEEVHFHEVGAVDSIVDVVGAALCIDYFKIQSVSSSPLPLGSGFVDCAHGRLPVLAPATVEILKGIPVHGGMSEGELVTPTGAAIIACLAKSFGDIPHMEVAHAGYGSGSRDGCGLPNLLRVLVGTRRQMADVPDDGDICLIETNIDDMNPEIYGYLMERLFLEGALDVCYVPVMMKKNRPGTKVEVLCPKEKRDPVTQCLFSETTTIGLRYHMVHRNTLKRSIATVATSFGDVQVKIASDPDGRTRFTPEYEACKRIANEKKVPLKAVYDAVTGSLHRGTDAVQK